MQSAGMINARSSQVPKPRRGCLFIAKDHTISLFLFVFRRRDEGYIVTQAHPLPTLQLVHLLHVRAAEKQKERISKAFGAYKQATPTGFWLRASSAIWWG